MDVFTAATLKAVELTDGTVHVIHLRYTEVGDNPPLTLRMCGSTTHLPLPQVELFHAIVEKLRGPQHTSFGDIRALHFDMEKVGIAYTSPTARPRIGTRVRAQRTVSMKGVSRTLEGLIPQLK